MLDGRRDDVIAGLCQTWLCQTEDGEVISFGAAAGEYDFRSAAAQKIRNRFARALHGGTRFLPMMMDGRRVPEMLAEVGTHGVENLGENGGAGVIVEIDPTHGTYFTLAWPCGEHRRGTAVSENLTTKDTKAHEENPI